MRNARPIIISAPSGTGKTTVIRRFLSSHPGLTFSVSCTTRPIRPGDVDGRDYHFIDEKVFRAGIKEGMFAEWSDYCGNLYGTPKGPLDDWLAEGKDVLLDLEVIGGTKLKALYGDRAISIFLVPPSEEELKRRLFGRGTDSPEAQKKRLETAHMEMTYKEKYDYQVINDDLDKACEEIEKIISRGEIKNQKSKCKITNKN